MADGGSKGLLPVVVGGVLALLATPVWGPPVCQAIGICERPAPSGTPPATTPGPGITLPPFSFPPDVETNIFLSKTSGPAGSTLNVSGEGFQAGETVIITMSTIEIGRTTASASGSFSNVEVTVPEDLAVFAPNQFYVTARGNASIRHAMAPFTVSG